jgi:hypothetical protein
MVRPRKKPPAKQRSAFRATAERIAEWLQPKEQLIDMIETALLAERERCAKIAETHSATDCGGPDCGVVIAAAIRQESTDAAKRD